MTAAEGECSIFSARADAAPRAARKLGGFALGLWHADCGAVQLMRIQAQTLAREFDELDKEPERARAVLSSLGYALKMNNLKVSSSQLVVDITTQALRICGTSGYRNDSRFSVVRYLRDAHSAALMISNDRIHASSGPLHLVHKDE